MVHDLCGKASRVWFTGAQLKTLCSLGSCARTQEDIKPDWVKHRRVSVHVRAVLFAAFKPRVMVIVNEYSLYGRWLLN